MNTYYFMAGADMRSAACAVDSGGFISPCDFLDEIEITGKFPQSLALKHVIYRNGKRFLYDDCSKLKTLWCDCQMNSALLFLCSQKLREIIDGNLKGTEGVRWISCTITYQSEKRLYYFPLFTKRLDVLDSNHLFLDEEKAKAYTMFTISSNPNWQIPSHIYVNQELKKAIRKADLQKGIYFNQAGIFF